MEAVIGNRKNTVGYALCYLNSTAAQSVMFRLGNDDGCAVMVNGKTLYSSAGSDTRNLGQDQYAFSGDLVPGLNTVLVEKTHVGHGLHFYLRLDEPEHEVTAAQRPDAPGRQIRETRVVRQDWDGRGVGQQ